ncbi:MAG TPA: alpha/beta hydrolase [Myxococcales bacterium]|nr:alpha/beta hydrolase [Myxococcales bacterium]
MRPEDASGSDGHAVDLRVGSAQLAGALLLPSRPLGVVLFVDVSGSTSCSPSHLFLARALEEAGLASLVLNLLTRSEAAADARTGWLRGDVPLLAGRIGAALRWLAARAETSDLPVGLFASDVAAPAALAAASEEPALAAVVCCAGPALAAQPGLERVRAPTLLVARAEQPVQAAAGQVLAQLHCEKELALAQDGAPGGADGGLRTVASAAARWFNQRLARQWLGANAP